MFGANLVIPAQIWDKLSHGHAKFPKILSQNGQSELEDLSRSMTQFSISVQEYPGMHVCCKFDDSSPNLWQVVAWTSQISKMAKVTMKVKVNDPHFQFSLEYSMIQVWYKFGDSSPKHKTSYLQNEYPWAFMPQCMIHHSEKQCVYYFCSEWCLVGYGRDAQCLKVMVAQLPLAPKSWTGPVKFDPGQVKIIIDYIRREIFWTFLGD